ncbi:MAG: hypothetical protein GC150_12925 [Rhizobiales bacterium]|nr:hypothetical protein [Hyphomicrobiales bacterium]
MSREIKSLLAPCAEVLGRGRAPIPGAPAGERGPVAAFVLVLALAVSAVPAEAGGGRDYSLHVGARIPSLCAVRAVDGLGPILTGELDDGRFLEGRLFAGVTVVCNVPGALSLVRVREVWRGASWRPALAEAGAGDLESEIVWPLAAMRASSREFSPPPKSPRGGPRVRSRGVWSVPASRTPAWGSAGREPMKLCRMGSLRKGRAGRRRGLRRSSRSSSRVTN